MQVAQTKGPLQKGMGSSAAASAQTDVHRGYGRGLVCGLHRSEDGLASCNTDVVVSSALGLFLAATPPMREECIMAWLMKIDVDELRATVLCVTVCIAIAGTIPFGAFSSIT